ncbi:MAG: hypothetical protein FWD34_02370 [Oscillospiraceae bacterium]|nr:hypothetical protein [Oscillospiraceae bacterium]
MINSPGEHEVDLSNSYVQPLRETTPSALRPPLTQRGIAGCEWGSGFSD